MNCFLNLDEFFTKSDSRRVPAAHRLVARASLAHLRLKFVAHIFSSSLAFSCSVVTETPHTARPPVIAVMGPTASGKSALGIELALRFEGEIINCDSVQVYREIEIATAKVSPAEQRGVPHHLLDFVPPTTTYTAGDWARDARAVIADIDARAHLPLIVGGTGLYLRALRRPFFQSPPTDARLRARLMRLRERRGAAHLHRMLQRVDPRSAARLHPADWSRTSRALEIRFQTRRTLHDKLQTPEPVAHEHVRSDEHVHTGEHVHADELACRLHIFVLDPPRDELYARINRRTLEHFERGLVEEVRTLLWRNIPAETSALGAHGYRRVVEHLRGERTLASAIEQTRIDVRRYAKRQWTWFKREPDVEWVAGFGESPEVITQVASRVAELLAGR